MRKILELMNEYDTKYSVIDCIHLELFGDFSGHVVSSGEDLASFEDQKDCIKQLKNILCERHLKN